MLTTQSKSRSGLCGALAVVAGLIVLHAPGAHAQADEASTKRAHVRGGHDAPHHAEASKSRDRHHARSSELPSTVDRANDTGAAAASQESGRIPANSNNVLYR